MTKAAPFMLLLLVFTSSLAFAESKTFGAYTIHYNAFTSDILTPSVAALYKIPRSKNRALVNITVVKHSENDSLVGEPVRAEVSGIARNLSEQLRELEIREIVEKNAVYYIAITPVTNKETLRYNFEISPTGTDITYKVSFQEQFFTE